MALTADLTPPIWTATQHKLSLPHIALLPFPAPVVKRRGDVLCGLPLDQYRRKLITDEEEVVCNLQLADYIRNTSAGAAFK